RSVPGEDETADDGLGAGAGSEARRKIERPGGQRSRGRRGCGAQTGRNVDESNGAAGTERVRPFRLEINGGAGKGEKERLDIEPLLRGQVQNLDIAAGASQARIEIRIIPG